MYSMRKFPLLLALLLAFASGGPRTHARADELRYAVAPDTNVWFYASESEDSRLFLLPETYYVRVLHAGDVYTAAEYLENDPPYRKVMGYCRTDALQFVDFIPSRPFLRRQITVSYTLGGTGAAPGYEFADVERTFVYYGERYEHGQLYFYVLEGETFGFIPAEEPLDFERNDDWLAPPTVPSGGTGGEGTEKPSSPVWQIVLLCAACVAAVAVAFLVLRGRRSAGGKDRTEP